jgi:hypothetical protein
MPYTDSSFRPPLPYSSSLPIPLPSNSNTQPKYTLIRITKIVVFHLNQTLPSQQSCLELTCTPELQMRYPDDEIVITIKYKEIIS